MTRSLRTFACFVFTHRYERCHPHTPCEFCRRCNHHRFRRRWQPR